MNRWPSFGTMFLALSVMVLHVSAQVTGRVTGSVADSSGSAIASATVMLMLPGGTSPVLQTLTTSDGLFNLTGVRAEFYDLAVEAQGFHRLIVRGVKIDPAQERSLPTFTLLPEPIQLKDQDTGQPLTLKVDVQAAAQTVQTANAEITTTITNEQVQSLPVNSRYALGLISTQAGVSAGRGPTVINGLRSSYSNVTLDGINIQDNFIRDNALTYTPNLPTLDQVAEFTVTSSNADATKVGGAAHVILVTPSGTNSFHGSGYWYNRNSALAANNWFNNSDGIENSYLNLNQLGGAVGGPIIKDKLLFYTNYEAYRYRVHPTVNRTILTEDARRGIFTYEDLQGAVHKVNILDAAGVSADPQMEQLLHAVPGPENINNFRVGDSRQSLLRNSAGYSFPLQGFHDRDNVTAKLDYTLSTANVFGGTFVWNRQTVSRSDLANDYSRVPKVANDDGRKFVSVAWRWNPVPHFSNEVRGGFDLAPLTFSTTEDLSQGVITGMVYNNPVNTFRPQGRNTNTYALMDNAVYVRGKHILQFGFQTQQIRVEDFNDNGVSPNYTLGIGINNSARLGPKQLPGIGSADLNAANNLLATLAGYLVSASQTFNVTNRTSGFVTGAQFLRHYGLNNYAFYVQDDWKLLPRLTTNLGLRYELPSVVDERDSLSLLPIIQNNDPIATLLSPNSTLDFAGSSAGRPWYKKDKNNFAPYFGLAWDVFGNGKTAVRGAYSISYVNDETIKAIMNNASSNEGLVAISSRTSLTGRVSDGLPAIATPVFKVPRTAKENFQINPYTAFGLPDPELRTPYVQQWSLGIQREIKGTIVEARYVGNHATKAFRAFDVNPEIIRENGFLADFKRAQQNGQLARAATGVFNPNYNTNIAGSQPLTVFPTLVAGGLLSNSFVRSLIETGLAGELAFQYQFAGLSGPVTFYNDPFSLASNIITNYSNTNYNALQIDIRHRTSKGIQFQGNYTYGKVLSDANGTDQNRFEELRDPNNAKIDRARPTFDITHAIKFNSVYDLPIGKGHWLNPHGLGFLLNGWAISGILTWQSGSPFSIYSRRGTLTRSFRSGENTASSPLDKAQLDNLFQFRQTGEGPFFVAASAIGSDGRAVASDGTPPFDGQAFFHPGPGEIGGLQRRMFSGPWTFNLDFGLLKKIKITENQSVQIGVEAFNLFNNPTWFVGDQDISSVSFGQITSTFYGPRLLQFSLHYRF